MISQILERGSVCSISSSLSPRDLMYSAERLQISHGAAENSLSVVETNITLIQLKPLIRNPGFGFRAVELFCAPPGALVSLNILQHRLLLQRKTPAPCERAQLLIWKQMLLKIPLEMHGHETHATYI